MKKQKYANETTTVIVDLFNDPNYNPPDNPNRTVPEFVSIKEPYTYDLITPSKDEGIRKVKNMTLQMSGNWLLTNSQNDADKAIDQTLYYIVRYINTFNGNKQEEEIPMKYPRPFKNPANIIMSGIFIPNKPLIQTTKLARNLKKGDKISIVFYTSQPKDKDIFITKQNIILTFNYSIKF